MSKETSQWLNQNTLVGMTEKRGNAWHYRATDQGSESNHYPGAIPVDDVNRRLFDWTAIPRRVAVEKPATSLEEATHLNEQGFAMKWVVETNRKAMVTSDTEDTLEFFKSGYVPHQYSEWLLDNVQTMLGDDLVISSAGLLRKRGAAWVEVSMPENKLVCGFEYRPNLLSCTSFDGSLSTTHKLTTTATVCDNTLSAALLENSPTKKIKHVKGSYRRINEARQALGIINSAGQSFGDTVKELTSAKVSPFQFKEVLSVLIPTKDKDNEASQHITAIKHREMTELWENDARIAPWTGTAFGVVQLFNTWGQHERQVRGETNRVERNSWESLNGEVDKRDAEVMRALRGLQLV